VRAAHADVWEAHGRHREAYGGGAVRLPGIRLMAAGLPHPQWNSGDVTDPAMVDIEAVRRWYDELGVPWGLRVALGDTWPYGRYLLTRRLMALHPGDYRAPDSRVEVSLRVAMPDDVEDVVAVDTVAFEEPIETDRAWIAPILSQPSTVVCLASIDGAPVGAGHCVVTDGDAGPAAYLGGIGVLQQARSRGVGTAISAWLIERGIEAGVDFLHLSPDTDHAARIYARRGFVELSGFDVYVDN
jgi:GNAT superfamily N-acetyltransferase